MIAFTIKRSDFISSISKTYFEVPNALISGCWREAWYSLSLSPPSASHVGVRYSAEIVTNGNEKSLCWLVADGLIRHFGGERRCGSLWAERTGKGSPLWRDGKIWQRLTFGSSLPYESSSNPRPPPSLLQFGNTKLSFFYIDFKGSPPSFQSHFANPGSMFVFENTLF